MCVAARGWACARAMSDEVWLRLDAEFERGLYVNVT